MDQGWRPQGFGPLRAGAIDDPIVEPLWGGDRTIVVVAGPDLAPEFYDEHGDAFDDPRLEPIVTSLAASIRADSVVLDGYLTRQPNVDQSLAATMGPAIPTHGQMLGQMFLGGMRSTRGMGTPDAAPIDPDLPLTFVAVDLLVHRRPAAPRRPAARTQADPRDRVRGGRAPPPGRLCPAAARDVDRELARVRLRELAYKGANSRYTPGVPNPGWAVAAIPNG